jgi:hypothetical protein
VREHTIAPGEQLRAQFLKARSIRLGASTDDEVSPGLLDLDVLAPDLPKTASQTISGHRGRLELRDDESHPRLARLIVDPDHVQVLETAAPAMGQAAADIGRAREPVGPRQARRWRQEPPCFDGNETVRRLRPFFRLRDSTARPQRVAIRARNPCLVIRRLFRGRYDGFIREFLQKEPWNLVGPERRGQVEHRGESEEPGGAPARRGA